MTKKAKHCINNTTKQNTLKDIMFLDGHAKLTALMPFVLDAIHEGVFIVEGDAGKFSLLQANLAVRKLLGIKNIVSGQNITELVDENTGRWLVHQLGKVMRFQESIETDAAWDTCRAGKQHVNVRFMPIMGEEGIDYIIGTVRVISDDIRLKENVRIKHERYVTALEYAPYGVCFINDDGKPSMINRALGQWLDMPINFIMQSHVSDFFSEIDKAVFKQALSKVISCGRSYRGIELQLRPVNGKSIWISLSMSRVSGSDTPYSIVQFVDITKRKSEETELMRLATQDHLTTLSNRKVFDDNLTMSIKQAKRYDRQGAVLYIDLNQFKAINDNYGHKAGDAILQEVGKVLKEVFRETDTVSRIGGDEFAVIMNEADTKEAERKAAIIEEKIRGICVTVHGKKVHVSASMGIQIFNADNTLTQEDLVAAADKAMYLNKAESKIAKPALDA
ncbi:MAG: diguanylate cyclase (GGDEF)-like protein/PAS domain S-box-containing protein [Alphaproteobacteria bacterium]|jgi:diguanylate cyclase (GGDEF)-like protein/PAS domain S-box-containing protein